jgi:hypothetical protein
MIVTVRKSESAESCRKRKRSGLLRTTTMSGTHPLSTVVSPTTTQLIENPPPIEQLIPFLSKSASLLASAASHLSSALVFLSSILSYSIILLASAPLQIILYVISPVLAFVQIVLGVLLVNPYHAIVNFFLVVQPFYVFCGVACISGTVIGLGGRRVARALTSALMGPEHETVELASFDKKPNRRKMR